MMKRTALGLTASVLALLFAVRATLTPATAQMGPMAQPLGQLSGDAFDKAFLEQMTMHHAMAVVMTRPVVANATHPELRTLGTSIISDQTREIALMTGWARDWYGLNLPDHVSMMDTMMNPPSQGSSPHAGHGGMMPGNQGMPGGMMAGHEGMAMGEMSMMSDLAKLPPARLEAVFMSLMIPHHQGALDMAALVPDRAAHQEIKDLAQNILRSQAEEIASMNAWLAAWYGL